MTGTDDSVANLERFIAYLTVATGALEQVTEHLGGTTEELVDLQDRAVDECGGLNENLETLDEQIETSAGDVREALEEAAQAAADAQDTLGEAQGQVERAAGDFEEKAEGASAELDEEHDRVTQQGFEGLGQAAAECEQELEDARQQTEAGFGEVETSVQALAGDAQGAWDAAEASLEHATSELSAHESSLAAESEECAHGFNTEAEAVANACSSLEGGTGTTYEGCSGEVDSQGQELVQGFEGIARETVTFVETGARERLEEPGQMVEKEALGPLTEEYAALEAALDTAVAVAGELGPLTDELVKCKAILGQIAALLDAMA